MGKIKVCHMTCVHKRYDARIFLKECISLHNNGYDVYLIVADGRGNEVKNGVKIYDIGSNKVSRLKRATKITRLVKRKALELCCDVYHFHDPELIFTGLSLCRKGKKVIYDMHEDYPGYFAEANHLPMKKLISFLYEKIELFAVKRFSGIVSTRQTINDRLSVYKNKIRLVTNYPILTPFTENPNTNSDEFVIAFCGAVVPNWTIDSVVDVIQDIDNIKFVLAGPISEDYMAFLQQKEGWGKVDYRGIIPFKEVGEIYKNASLGVAIYHYCSNMGGKEGNLANTKMFEFMNAGLPYICTDFRLWKQIVETEVNCGICVEPGNKIELRKAIEFFMSHEKERYLMGLNGRNAAETKYNWATQEQNLLSLYDYVNR